MPDETPNPMLQKKSFYVTRLIQRTVDALDAMDGFAPLRKEWDEMGYGTGAPNAITNEELAILTPHLTVEKLTALMVSIDAVAALRAAGHGTNLQNIRP